MKAFNNIAAQGDVFFIRRDKLPAGLKLAATKNGRVVIAHSETGHDHSMVMDREPETPNVVMYESDNPLIAWLLVNRPTPLEHQRPHDTHETIVFAAGVYEVRRQREFDPYAELARQVAD